MMATEATKRITKRAEGRVPAIDAAPIPSGPEVLEAIKRWKLASDVASEARAEEEAARRDLVAALHAIGLTGFVL